MNTTLHPLAERLEKLFPRSTSKLSCEQFYAELRTIVAEIGEESRGEGLQDGLRQRELHYANQAVALKKYADLQVEKLKAECLVAVKSVVKITTLEIDWDAECC